MTGGDGDDQITTGRRQRQHHRQPARPRSPGGDDTIQAGDGNDFIDDRLGDNLIEGGAGNDTIYLQLRRLHRWRRG